jgi:hypothetical protein
MTRRPWIRSGLALLLVGALGACVSTHMKQFLGKDARMIQVKDGPPVNVFDLPDGRRAFQYLWGGGTYAVPATQTTQGRVQIIGDAIYYTEQKIGTGGYVVNNPGCLITYLAHWDAAKRGWIVDEISYPKRLAC